MSTFAVWAQIIDDTTGIENIDSHGSVHDVEAEYENDDGGTPNKQFCDGQTSKTPPRYAQDQMAAIYTRSRESADVISGFLRQDVQQRIASGSLRIPLPSWYVPRLDAATGAILARDAALLKLRAYYEFRQYPTSTIDEVLATVLDGLVDTKQVGSILREMRRRLPN